MAAATHPFLADAKTERLWLRRWSREHAAGPATAHAEPEVMEFLDEGEPLSAVESGLVANRVMEHWTTFHFGLWAVMEKSTGDLVGLAGLCHPLWFPERAGSVEV